MLLSTKLTIRQIENQDTKRRSKHVDIKYHYVRHQLKLNLFRVQYIETNNLGWRETMYVSCCFHLTNTDPFAVAESQYNEIISFPDAWVVNDATMADLGEESQGVD